MNKYIVKYMSDDYAVSTEIEADSFFPIGPAVTFIKKGELIEGNFGMPPYQEQVNVAYFASVISVEKV